MTRQEARFSNALENSGKLANALASSFSETRLPNSTTMIRPVETQIARGYEYPAGVDFVSLSVRDDHETVTVMMSVEQARDIAATLTQMSDPTTKCSTR